MKPETQGSLWPLAIVAGGGIIGGLAGYYLGPAFIGLVLVCWVLSWFVVKW